MYIYKHEKARYRHSHRVPVAGRIVCCNRLKLNRLHYPPPIAYSMGSEATWQASVRSVTAVLVASVGNTERIKQRKHRILPIRFLSCKPIWLSSLQIYIINNIKANFRSISFRFLLVFPLFPLNSHPIFIFISLISAMGWESVSEQQRL